MIASSSSEASTTSATLLGGLRKLEDEVGRKVTESGLREQMQQLAAPLYEQLAAAKLAEEAMVAKMDEIYDTVGGKAEYENRVGDLVRRILSLSMEELEVRAGDHNCSDESASRGARDREIEREIERRDSDAFAIAIEISR